MRAMVLAMAFLGVACGGDPASGIDGGDGDGDGDGDAGGDGDGPTLAEEYPGDVGIGDDPAVVWAENFEAGSVDAVLARYDDFKNQPGMALEADVPAASSGDAAMRLTASGTGVNATDFYKNLGAGSDELWVRWYAKYEAGVTWHHTGVWVGGYNPPSNWPSPQAGLKPDGDDRFSVSLEPVQAGTDARLDFYNYWMTMHSWMDVPSGDTAYYGNTLVHDSSLVAPGDSWICIEVHIRLNPDPGSPAGGELGLWVDDVPVIQFTDASPLGYWVKDKFCPDAADGTECTDYRPTNPDLVPLDLQWRSTADLRLNAFWPQNYITEGGEGSVWYDDMVLATRRIGCIR